MLNTDQMKSPDSHKLYTPLAIPFIMDSSLQILSLFLRIATELICSITLVNVPVSADVEVSVV